MSIDTGFDLQPIDTDPTDGEQTIDAPPAPSETTPTAATKPAPKVQHAEGGLPAVPLLVIGSNTAAAGLSATAIAAGPLAALGVAAGTVVTAAAMSARSKQKARAAARRPAPKPTPKKPSSLGSTTRKSGGWTGGRSNAGGGGRGKGAASGSRSGGAGTGRRTPSPSTGAGGKGGLKKAGSLTKPSASGPKAVPAARKNSAPSTTAGKTNAGKANAGKSTTGKTTKKDASAGGKGRFGQIKDLRAAKKNEGKTRKQQRQQNTENRRALKDGRRGEKKALKNLKKQSAPAGKAGTVAALKKAGDKAKMKAATKTAATRAQARVAKDQQVLTRGERIKQARRNAKARAVRARKILSSNLRFGAKALGAALLAAPVGLLGCLATPLGRKLGWKWLMYPGRRAYWRLTGKARAAHLARLQAAKEDPTDTTDDDALATTAPRHPRTAPTLTGVPTMADLKFLFEESAADMEEAAQAYEPGGMMHVYQTIQGMPAGITSWANTFKILAEKSDDSFPLDPQVGEALGEVFDYLRKAAAAAEEVQETFEKKHEHDIERLNAPRKSLEAEKAWDITNNEDFL